MKSYNKPVIEILPEKAEGVFTASGSNGICRFGRPNFNPHSDTCRACEESGGTSDKWSNKDKGIASFCIDNVPSNKK